MKHNILVLGGAGYIGSIVVEELLKRGHTVIVYDNLSTGNRQAVSSTFIEGDISNKELLSETMKKYEIDIVMHFCAFSLIGESMEKPEKYFINNVIHGLNVLEAMRENNIKKIIFSSTASVYGAPKKIPIQETDTIAPNNTYGETKVIFEKFLTWYKKIHNINHVSLRYFNAAGASEKYGEDHNPESHLIPIILDVVLGKRDSIKIFGADYPTKDGTCIRDYIHVLDLTEAHIKAIDYDGSLIVNLGSGEGYSVKEVIETTKQVTGKEIKTETTERRVGDPPVLIASSKLAKEKLGWQPKYSIKEIISSAWLWKKTHPNGYKNKS